MLHSEHRILTTHTGSLPRPPALTELYARRAAGETVDAAAIDAAGKAATRDVVRKQIAAGIDVGNNGEQMREAFFLYVRHRMSGFGGSWNRKPMADALRYPGFRAWGDSGRTGPRSATATACRRRSARCAISIAPRCRRNAPNSAPRWTRSAAPDSPSRS